MKTKNYIFSILCIAIAGLAIYMFYSKSSSKSTEGKKVRIAYVVPTLLNPYFVDMTGSAKQEADQHKNVELIVQAPEKVEDAIGQNQIVENLITQKVDAICVVPTNSETMLPVIKKANEANIPVLNIDNKVDNDKARKTGVVVTTYIGSNNFDGGRLAGEFLIKKLGGKGKVAILEGISGNDAAINRKGGFLKALETAPNITVVASQVANWNREQAFNIFQNILKANPGLNGVFACNDEMALGAFAALSQSGISKDKVVIIGFDAVEEALKAVKMKQIDATVAQQPILMGKKAIQLAIDAVQNKKLNKSYNTDLKLITP